jgi:CelD/BcsL family acetyltransferase involved in cellulose biosynthesis
MIHADIEIQVIDCLDDLLRIKDEWNAVQDACEHKHVFLDHRFITAWWKHLGRGKSMHTLVLRRAGTVEGIVPLALSRGWEAFPTTEKNIRIAEDFQYLPAMRWRRVVPIRRLTFPLSLPSSNLRAHFLLRRADPEQIGAVLSYCQKISDQWDLVSLDGIPEGSEQEALLSAAAARLGLRRGRSRHTRPLLYATLPGSMDAFLAERSHNFRSGLRRARRQSIERTAALGGFRICEFRGHAIDEGMTKLFDLERQSWKAKTTRKREIHVTLNDASSGFYRDVAKAFAASDQAQVLVTEVGGRPANALYSIERQGIIICVLTYQAEEFANLVTVAPLWGRFFEIAIGRGVRQVDFNGHSSYLARYANGENSFSRLVFYNTAFYSTLLRATANGANLLAHAFSR